ncbi:hypothetical protein [Tepidibacter formicigenes]|jgi:hypothetical protein|uniref:Uncharacterized protein n=1 Tax=Tepidibacter formicigenes DSM 15518 TaxID=1123349 RepID=A0A1M6P0B2_9FIRM|nr:hypothetical protein [Tepidibacter formicigenes]SHK01405.1 hypothetical protein SAMN02744037_01424 [Tepidibacter formicigenes DSM 15518]
MNILKEIELFRDSIYKGEKLDNNIMNSILQFLGKELSQDNLSNESKTKIKYCMNICIDALSNKDYVYLADIFYFEIIPLLK